MRSQNVFIKRSTPVASLAASVFIAVAAFFVLVNPVGAQTVVGSVPISGGLRGMGETDVNPNTDRVYVQSATTNFDGTITVINASDKTNPMVVTTIGGNAFGLTANTVTNRFYTTDGYGGNIRVFDGTTNSLIATVFKGYCHAGMDTNETTNLIYSVRSVSAAGSMIRSTC